MPFDGAHYHFFAPPVRRPKYDILQRAFRILAWATTGMVCLCIGFEASCPNYGPLTILFEGVAVARRNIIAQDLIAHAKSLQFTVAGHRYTVVTPDHTLAGEELSAWVSYAKWKNYPAYTADGPMAIDP